MSANRFVSVLALMVVGAVSVRCAEAQGPARQADRAEANHGELPVMAYDVGDLVMNITDYPYPGSDFGAIPVPVIGGVSGGGGGGFGGGGGGVFQFGGGGGGMSGTGSGGLGGGGIGVASSSVGAPTSMDDLKRVILSVVAPDTWAENGGNGRLESFGNSLLVAQTPAVQQLVESLLQQLRAGSGERKTVSIDAYWLLLTSDEVDQLLEASQDGTPSLSQERTPMLSRERLAEFTRRPASIRGRTNCFSGQLVYVVCGTKKNVVSGYIPVVGSLDDGSSAARLASLSHGAKVRFVANEAVDRDKQRNVGYQPIVEKPNVGALLEIRPTLVKDGNSAIVDLKATVTGSAEPAGDAAAAPPAPPEVDRVAIHSQVLATTLRVPLSKPVLVGGLTYQPAEARAMQNMDGVPAGVGEYPQLYFVLEVR